MDLEYKVKILINQINMANLIRLFLNTDKQHLIRQWREEEEKEKEGGIALINLKEKTIIPLEKEKGGILIGFECLLMTFSSLTRNRD